MADEKPAYIAIAKWDELQHYKKRNPPWIKLYNRLLDSHRWGGLQDASKGHYTGLLMLASKEENEIPLDVDWIAGRIAARTPLDLRPLISAGLVEVYHRDSEPLAQSRQDEGETLGLRDRDRGRDRGQSTGDSLPTVEKSPGEDADVDNSPEDDGETWNDRLAPVVREVAYLGTGPPDDWSLGRCMSRLKQLKDQGYSTDELEDGLRGLRWMVEREHSAICDKEGTPFIRRGSKFRCVVFNRAEERGMPLLRTAAHQWRKHGEPSENGRSRSLASDAERDTGGSDGYG